jgi:hypothetical protein
MSFLVQVLQGIVDILPLGSKAGKVSAKVGSDRIATMGAFVFLDVEGNSF